MLVADADHRAACSIARQLSDEGVLAHPTHRGTQSLAFATDLPLAVAVVDAQLADMSGYDCVSHLRRIDPAVRIIVTARGRVRAAEIRARELGILHYAIKPIRFERLYAAIIAGIAGRPDVR